MDTSEDCAASRRIALCLAIAASVGCSSRSVRPVAGRPVERRDAIAPDVDPVDAAASSEIADAREPDAGGPVPAGPRMAWWHEARFGMFIHWGLYSALAGSWNGQRVRGGGEWIMTYAKIPVQDYAGIADTFNPTRFDADEWIRIAKDAGMEYVVLTAKHHEGFAMYPSKVSPFNLTDATPFKRDPVRELSEAARRQGLRFGVYYSQAMDWHHPGGTTPGPEWDPAHAGDTDEYLRTIAVPQVRELLTSYPDLAVLWWDMPVGMTPARAAPLQALLALQPQIITNNRLGGRIPGDYDVSEQNIPGVHPARPFETCMTMNGTWGYRSDDERWKTPATLVRALVDSASKGGNFLLNVGPTAEGVIPQASVDRLAEMGRWLRANGEAIRGASDSKLRDPDWGRTTSKPKRLYLHVFDWPASGTVLVPMKNRPRRVYPLGAPATLLASRVTDTGVEVDLPAHGADPLPSVFVVEMAEDGPVPAPIGPRTDGSFVLPAADAQLVGTALRLEANRPPDIGHWTRLDDSVHWDAFATRTARYQVTVEYSCPPGSEGSTYLLSAGARSLAGTTLATADAKSYVVSSLGELDLDRGPVTVTLKATTKPGSGLMNLRAVVLRPL
jgi:alpha-L-fucosidase